MAHPNTTHDATLPSPLSSHMIKHHLRFRNISTINEGGEKDREARLKGAIEYETGDIVSGIVAAAKDNDMKTLLKTLPFLRHVTQDHYLELLNEPLDAAAHSNNSTCVEELLKWGANPNRLFNGKPASVVAASRGNMESLQVMMNYDCNIDVQSNKGYTPLMAACSRGHNEVAIALIDAGANRDIRSEINCSGLTALMIVAKGGNMRLCQALLEPSASNGTPGCLKELKELRVGYTPLIFAARRDFVSVIELFAGKGVDIHGTDNDGMEAIHHAAHFNKFKSLRYFWTIEKCINSQDNQGRTPLIIAVQRGNRAIVELCVGVEISTFNRDGSRKDPRKEKKKQEEAAARKREEESKYGKKREEEYSSEEDEEENENVRRGRRNLAEDINLEAKDNDGKTALIWAVLNGYHLLVPLLMVDGGCDLNVTDNIEKTALDYATELLLPDMCILLNNCVLKREQRVTQIEMRRIREEKERAKAARRAEMSDSEFDFTSSEEEDDEED